MKYYWRLKGVPELRDLSRSERRKVVAACFFRHRFRMWQFWAALLAFLVSAFLGRMIGVILCYGYGFSGAFYYAGCLLGLLVGCVVYLWLYYTLVIERLRPHLREYLAAHPPAG